MFNKVKNLIVKARTLSPTKKVFTAFLFSQIPLSIYCYFRFDDFYPHLCTKFVHFLSSKQIPVSLRKTLFEYYCGRYSVNKDQIAKPLQEFSTFSQFFTRKIKQREVNKEKLKSAIVCPADSKILSIQEIQKDQSMIVKDVPYSIGTFLFETKSQLTSQLLNKLKSKPQNKLYQVIFYLSPGDYHRFHSPASFHALFTRQISGKLRKVNEKSLQKWKGKVYEENSRKIVHGYFLPKQKIKYYMSLGLVGALNVNQIHLNEGQDFKQGEQLGYFNLGSTIVMIFEAKKIKKWRLEEGKKVKYGQVLCEVE